MKKSALSLGLFFVLVLSLTLIACNPQEVEPSEITSPLADEASVAPAEETGYEGLGLTEDEIKLLEERGVANVASVEVASKIAGFTVAVPAYLPDDFKPGKYMISISGAGLPSEMAPKFNNTQVQRTYSHEDGQTMFLIIQATQSFVIGGSEPVDLCGQPAERKFTPAAPSDSPAYDKLTFSWEQDGLYYAITGFLSENLDEEELKKIACSISAE